MPARAPRPEALRDGTKSRPGAFAPPLPEGECEALRGARKISTLPCKHHKYINSTIRFLYQRHTGGHVNISLMLSLKINV
jgi:hypothetical protein